MGCRSDYMESTEIEKDYSKVLGLLDELETGKLPDNFGDGYDKRVYNKFVSKKEIDLKTKELCSKLQETDVTKYSLELQIWWRDHKISDLKRLKAEIKENKDLKAKEKLLKRLTPYEKKLLGIK